VANSRAVVVSKRTISSISSTGGGIIRRAVPGLLSFFFSHSFSWADFKADRAVDLALDRLVSPRRHGVPLPR
jgi:hypothetical protein